MKNFILLIGIICGSVGMYFLRPQIEKLINWIKSKFK